MALFDFLKKEKDEYSEIYGYDEEDSRNYEELDENEDPEDVIDRLRGTIGRGDCLLCGAHNAMTYEGNICFVCSKCRGSVHEDIYYRWAAGYPIDFND